MTNDQAPMTSKELRSHWSLVIVSDGDCPRRFATLLAESRWNKLPATAARQAHCQMEIDSHCHLPLRTESLSRLAAAKTMDCSSECAVQKPAAMQTPGATKAAKQRVDSGVAALGCGRWRLMVKRPA